MSWLGGGWHICLEIFAALILALCVCAGAALGLVRRSCSVLPHSTGIRGQCLPDAGRMKVTIKTKFCGVGGIFYGAGEIPRLPPLLLAAVFASDQQVHLVTEDEEHP